jgi:hypothetical protein
VIVPSIGQIFNLARERQDLYSLQTKMKDGLLALDERVRAIEIRVTRLEAEQGQIISDAKSAATSAATIIAGAVIADAVTRVTRVEDRVERLEPWPIQRVGDNSAGR